MFAAVWKLIFPCPLTPDLDESQICFVKKGILRNYFKVGKKEATYHISVAGQFNSTIAAFDSSMSGFEYIQALDDCELFYMNYTVIQELFEKHHNFAKVGIQVIQSNFVSLHRRMRDLLTIPALERYQKLVNEKPELLQLVPQIYLASFLGITPESLSRLRKQISKG